MTLPDLTTARLLLRQFTPADHADALAIYGDDRVTRGLGMEAVAGIEEMRAHFERVAERVKRYPAGQGGWAVTLADSGELIGGALLKPLPDSDEVPTEHIEVGWHLSRAHWRMGYATEAGHALLAYGFERLHLEAIHAVMFPWNSTSATVATRLGMTYRGRTDAFYGEHLDWYTIDRAAWAQ